MIEKMSYTKKKISKPVLNAKLTFEKKTNEVIIQNDNYNILGNQNIS